MVLRGDFTQADLIALRQTFRGQLVTLEDDGDEAHHTLVVWPPPAEEGGGGGESRSERASREAEEPAGVVPERGTCRAGEKAR